MRWTASTDGDGYSVLDIEVPWEEIAEEYADLVRQYAAAVQVPGFRPGKTPRGAIEQRFRAKILADLSARVVQRLGREAVREAGIEALGPVEASEIKCLRGEPFHARVRCLPMPEFQLPELANLVPGDDDGDPRDRIARQLLDLVPLEVPTDLVRQELRLDGLEESAPGSDAWSAASERLRLMVILKRIARQEGIEVDDRDVTQRIAAKAAEFGRSNRDLESDLEREGGMARLQDMLLAEHTLDYLMGRKHE